MYEPHGGMNHREQRCRQRRRCGGQRSIIVMATSSTGQPVTGRLSDSELHRAPHLQRTSTEGHSCTGTPALRIVSDHSRRESLGRDGACHAEATAMIRERLAASRRPVEVVCWISAASCRLLSFASTPDTVCPVSAISRTVSSNGSILWSRRSLGEGSWSQP